MKSPFYVEALPSTRRMVVSIQFYDKGVMVIRTRKRQVFETIKKYLEPVSECMIIGEGVKDCFKVWYGDGAHSEIEIQVELIEG